MELWTQVQLAIAAALRGIPPESIRIPARRAACDCYLPDASGITPACFGTLFGVPLVASARAENGRLLLDLTDAFYDACVLRINEALPLPSCDCGDHALNRMQCLSRHGGSGCPKSPSVQRALWLCAGAAHSPSIAGQAGRAFLTMLHGMPAQQRQSQLHACGAVAGACARLYAASIQKNVLPKRAALPNPCERPPNFQGRI